MFRDDVPSFRYLRPMDYWLGRAKAGVGQPAQAVEHFKRFLARRPGARELLVDDARQRLARLGS